MRWLESESNFDMPSTAAIAMLREAIAQQPNNPVLYARLGDIFEKSRLFGDGAEAYETAARQAAEDFAAWPKLANCYVELDRPEAALDACRRGEARGPSADSTFKGAARCPNCAALPTRETRFGRRSNRMASIFRHYGHCWRRWRGSRMARNCSIFATRCRNPTRTPRWCAPIARSH